LIQANEEAKENVQKLEELKTTDLLSELKLLHKQGVDFIEPTDLSGAIRGRYNIYTHLELMIKNSEKKVTLVTTSKGLLRKADTLKAELERLSKKGVKIRVAAPINKTSAKVIKELSKFAEIRDSGKLSARFCIVDDKEIMFMAMDDEEVHPTYDVGIWINTPYFARALSGLFENTWSKLSTVDNAALS
jgi:sugar-specific transcriptional regulator TrmB